MSEQPEALRLADVLDGPTNSPITKAKAAAELRRQHSRIKELEAALNKYSEDETLCKWTDRITNLEQALDVAHGVLEQIQRMGYTDFGDKMMVDDAIAKLKEVRRD